jgi:homogentisate 1,2-dioxygenase
LNLPFYYNNDDYDEVLFYHCGDFFSRGNIKGTRVTFHSAGFTHDPHPKAFEAKEECKKTFTDEVALMLDTLDIYDSAVVLEKTEYVNSWH